MDATPRTALMARLEALVGREAALARHLRGEDGRREADSGDVANFTSGDEVLTGLEEAALTEILQIRGALDRLDAGTYGTCVSCDAAVAPARLQALPATPFCRDCAP